MTSKEKINRCHKPETSGTRRQWKKTPFFQAKLTVGPADDAYEREADAVAEKVMRMEDTDHVQAMISPGDIRRKSDQGAGAQTEAPAEVHDAIHSTGTGLDDATRSFMESRLGYDFKDVKVHTDTLAAKSAQSINALAYTSGNDIVFNAGQYLPGTESGKRLLAHELTHVVQQGGGVQAKTIQRSEGDELTGEGDGGEYNFEQEADRPEEMGSGCGGQVGFNEPPFSHLTRVAFFSTTGCPNVAVKIKAQYFEQAYACCTDYDISIDGVSTTKRPLKAGCKKSDGKDNFIESNVSYKMNNATRHQLIVSVPDDCSGDILKVKGTITVS
jgi:hypothetical protein